jgi:hypothetical protein
MKRGSSAFGRHERASTMAAKKGGSVVAGNRKGIHGKVGKGLSGKQSRAIAKAGGSKGMMKNKAARAKGAKGRKGGAGGGGGGGGG